MLRSVIIDDENIGINTLKVLIEKHTPDVKVIGTATDPAEGVTLIDDYKPDIVFLDISMPGIDGFGVLAKAQFKDFRLIFTTAHPEYALKAIKIRAQDYLLKPIDVDDLKTCISNVANDPEIKARAMRHRDGHIIELSVRDGIIFIRPKDVIRLEADGSYTTFYLENGIKHVASKNLKECEALITAPYFFRCHASHLVNLKKVVKMVSTDGLFALMSDGSMPEIGRKNKDAFLERLKEI
jgi:two-component system, LytTR family, response regulator